MSNYWRLCVHDPEFEWAWVQPGGKCPHCNERWDNIPDPDEARCWDCGIKWDVENDCCPVCECDKAIRIRDYVDCPMPPIPLTPEEQWEKAMREKEKKGQGVLPL